MLMETVSLIQVIDAQTELVRQKVGNQMQTATRMTTAVEITTRMTTITYGYLLVLFR